MNICVCGWYFHAPFYHALESLKDQANIYIVSHRKGYEGELPHIVIPNVGFEWHAYNHYVMEVWENGDTVFLQDDTELLPGWFERLEALQGIYDQVFVFTDEAQAQVNSQAHGRALYVSDRFIRVLRLNDGFWFNTDKRLSSNAGILAFVSYLWNLGRHRPDWTVNKTVIIPEIKNGRRGYFKS